MEAAALAVIIQLPEPPEGPRPSPGRVSLCPLLAELAVLLLLRLRRPPALEARHLAAIFKISQAVALVSALSEETHRTAAAARAVQVVLAALGRGETLLSALQERTVVEAAVRVVG